MATYFGIVDIWVFVAGTIVIILAPGPNSIYVLSSGIRWGVKKGYQAAAGIIVGDALLMFMAAMGVASLTRLYPHSFAVIQYAGAAYLMYLGIKVIYREIKNRNTSSPIRVLKENTFKKAFLLSLVNPKAILFFVSFFVQFVQPGFPYPWLSFLILGLIVELTSITYLSILIVGGSRLAAFFKGRHRLSRLARTLVGVLFLGFGARLACAVQ